MTKRLAFFMAAMLILVTGTAFALNPSAVSKFYFDEDGQLVGQSLLTSAPQESHGGNVHTAYYVSVAVSCARPTPPPPIEGPVPGCIPGSQGCTCYSIGTSGYECPGAVAALNDAGKGNVQLMPPFTGRPGSPGFVNPALLTPPCGDTSGCSDGARSSDSSGYGPVAGTYVSEWVLPEDLTIQAACRQIECDSMPTPITDLGWTWVGGYQ